MARPDCRWAAPLTLQPCGLEMQEKFQVIKAPREDKIQVCVPELTSPDQHFLQGGGWGNGGRESGQELCISLGDGVGNSILE